MDTQQYYLVDTATGSLRFTDKGRRELGRLFGFAGIDLKSVRTQDDYQEAVFRVRQAVQGMASRQLVPSRCRQVALAAFESGSSDRSR